MKMRGIPKTRYTVECYDVEGNLKWTESFDNIVVDEGLNLLLDNSFTAPAGAVTWFVGLKDTGTVAAGDTLASHAGWVEMNPYAGNRPAYVPNGAASAGAISNSGSKAVFTINSGTTVYGAFLASVNTGTSGQLYGAGDFGAPRAVLVSDSLRVQIDPSVA